MNDEFPRGKLNADDEGQLAIRIGVKDRTVVIDFGKQVVWFGMDYFTAKALAENILKHAEAIKPKSAVVIK